MVVATELVGKTGKFNVNFYSRGDDDDATPLTLRDLKIHRVEAETEVPQIIPTYSRRNEPLSKQLLGQKRLRRAIGFQADISKKKNPGQGDDGSDSDVYTGNVPPDIKISAEDKFNHFYFPFLQKKEPIKPTNPFWMSGYNTVKNINEAWDSKLFVKDELETSIAALMPEV